MRDDKSDPTPRDSAASGFYLVGGVILALALTAGLLFFNPASGPGEGNDQARPPDQMPARP